MGCIGLERRGFLTGVMTHLFHVCREHHFHRVLAPQSRADDMKSMTGGGRKKNVRKELKANGFIAADTESKIAI